MTITGDILAQLKPALALLLQFKIPTESSTTQADLILSPGPTYPVDLRLRWHGSDIREGAGSLVIPTYWDRTTVENSVLRSLQPGDDVTFDLSLDCGSPLLDDHHLVMDILYLRVLRGDEQFVYPLKTSITTPLRPTGEITFF